MLQYHTLKSAYPNLQRPIHSYATRNIVNVTVIFQKTGDRLCLEFLVSLPRFSASAVVNYLFDLKGYGGEGASTQRRCDIIHYQLPGNILASVEYYGNGKSLEMSSK